MERNGMKKLFALTLLILVAAIVPVAVIDSGDHVEADIPEGKVLTSVTATIAEEKYIKIEFDFDDPPPPPPVPPSR